MTLTDKIQYAINRAAELHAGQKRKVSGAPFFTHPFSVAIILSKYTSDEDIIVAGLLHDVLEDVPNYSYADMKKEFGKKIADIVKEVTERYSPQNRASAKATWMKRKLKYLEQLKKDSNEAMMISAADKIHNLKSIIEEYEEKGNALWKEFNAPENSKLWFYGEVLKILKNRLYNKSIVKELESVYEKAEQVLRVNSDQVIPQGIIITKFASARKA